MQHLLKIFMSIVVFVFVYQTSSTAKEAKAPTKNTIKRIGGDYLVKSITKNKDGAFVILFDAENKSSEGNQLKLVTDHIHMSINEGAKLRLSAEILDHSEKIWEVSQVVLFIPRPEGPTPVWILSNKAQTLDLNATDYLKMHYPQSDYMIF